MGFKLPIEYQNAVDNFFANYIPFNNGHSSSNIPMLNPYADDSLNVEVNLISPDGRHIKKWGFFMRMANFNVINDLADSGKNELGADTTNILSPYSWRFRFAPDYEGTWTFSVTISNPKGPGLSTYTFNNFSFYCDAPTPTSNNHGFLKINQSNPSGYLQFDDGTPFFGIGENLADIRHGKTTNSFYDAHWYEFLKIDYDDYNTTFDEMSSGGANYTRIFMMKGGFAAEWQNLGVYDVWAEGSRSCCPSLQGCTNDQKSYKNNTYGNSTVDMNHGNRQYNLWAFDNLIEKAHEDGIYIQLCIDPYPPGSGYQDFIWGDHAYAYYTYDNNAKTHVDSLFASPKLRYYWKRRYKYILSRYGYSVNLAALETFNEIDGVMGFKNDSLTGQNGGGYCSCNCGKFYSIPGLRDTINNWHTDILGYAKNIIMPNANKHLTTVSFTDYGAWCCHDDIKNTIDQQNFYHLLTNPNIDFADIHSYINGQDKNQFGFLAFISSSSGFVRNTLGINNKPFHFGECMTPGNITVAGAGKARMSDTVEYFNGYKLTKTGSNNQGTCNFFNNYDISFHNELWATTFMNIFTSSLTWAWETVHWWPDANPTKAYYTTSDFATVDNVLGDPNTEFMPDGSQKTFFNKKIYHDFEPLSNFVQQTPGIDFSQHYTPMKFYGDGVSVLNDYQPNATPPVFPSASIECYYLLDNGNTGAYGWVHNLNYYWLNNYYYYSDGTTNINYENLSGCGLQAKSTQPLFWINLSPNTKYSIAYYYTRMGSAPSNFPQYSVQTTDASGAFYIDVTSLGCDSTTADFAFSISLSSGTPTGRTTNIQNKTNNDDFDILISPNPSDGVYNIKINKTGSYNISVYNSIGDIILVENDINKNATVDLSSQPVGIYYIKVSEGNNNLKHFKLIKR